MKLTLGWLKQHLETSAPPAEIIDRLTAIGLEVESVHDPAAALKPFSVAEVLSAEPHPNADRLKLCRVRTNGGTVQVVCGAPNARAGMKTIFAPVGSTIPGTGLVLKPSTIRGVAKTFGIPEEEFGRASKLVPKLHGLPMALEKAAGAVGEIGAFRDKYPPIWNVCLKLEGVMNGIYLDCQRDTDVPDLILFDKTFYALYWGVLQAQQRFRQSDRS